MLANGAYQMALVERLAFNRIATSPEEARAAQILADEVRALGGEPVIEEFPIPRWEISCAKLTVTAPYTAEIPVIGIGRSGSTPEGGLEAELVYVGRAEENDLRNVAGKIILMEALSYDVWKRVAACGCAGFLVLNGNYFEDESTNDIPCNCLRDSFLRFGKIPGMNLRTCDALDMVKRGAARVRMELTQREYTANSRNVTAFIPGTDKADEIISYTAHLDSVPYAPGAWDNASGCADIMAAFRHFMANPPRRSLRFVWCGAEEVGLLGSQAYAAAHPEEMAKIRFGINVDMTGPALGYDRAITTADKALVDYLAYMARECGHTLEITRTIHPSDSTPFADAGVPTLTFNRWGRAAGHSRHDFAIPLSAQAFAGFWDFQIAFAERIVNTEVVPVPREIPEDLKKELDHYFHRDEN